MQWFRLYHDLVYNAKAQSLSPKLFKAWINLMCLASKNEHRGELPSLSQIAFGLHTNEDSAQAILESLSERRFIEKESRSIGEVWLIYGWTESQPESDNVSARVNKHRMSKIDENVTLQKRNSNGTDTDTDKRRRETLHSPLPSSLSNTVDNSSLLVSPTVQKTPSARPRDLAAEIRRQHEE